MEGPVRHRTHWIVLLMTVFVGLVDPADAQKPRQEEKPRPDDVIILKCAWRENLG